MTDFPNFFGSAPNYQFAFDLFKGEWSTRLPDACGWVASTGPARHCEDYRVTWAAEKLGGFSGKRILELGPMEAGHSYMLEKMGAAEVVAIEGNSRAFLKCLIVKEAFGLTRVRFILGDFLPFFTAGAGSFDTIFACGVLYHVLNPIELIEQIASHCTEVFVWSHFFDADFFKANSTAGSPFDPPAKETYKGFEYTRNVRRYEKALEWKGFCGGGAPMCCWLNKDDIFRAFVHFGFKIVDSVEEKNPNGPAVLFVARK